jgi:hypothetical protein
MTHAFHALTVERAAEAYVRSRGKARFLSIEQAIRAIRTLMPKCKATDHELEELLAETCIAHGVPVAFDAGTAGQSGNAAPFVGQTDARA